MHADITTIKDLSIFTGEEHTSLFQFLDRTKTIGGSDWLAGYFKNPLPSASEIRDVQFFLQKLNTVTDQWPENISNGTIMVIEKYYQSGISGLPEHPSWLQAISFKFFNGPDYAIVRYSVKYFIHLLQGMHTIYHVLEATDNPPVLKIILNRINLYLRAPIVQEIIAVEDPKKLSLPRLLYYGYYFLHHYKAECQELVHLFHQLDGYRSMALAGHDLAFSFPEILDTDAPVFEAEELYHPLLQKPVSYPVHLYTEKNFLFLTGANMAGKSTFIKAVGVATYLAHLGMAVPAKSLRLCFFDGLLSNIHVVDNIVKGESYFYNEVQRIKNTILKIGDGKKWLVLIDELFKGTNVDDAMRCSTVVIEGLLKIRTSLFILSTHLYEIAGALKTYPNIQFNYFETAIHEGTLVFNYHLKPGVSTDRLGYLILQKEGIMELLASLSGKKDTGN